MAHNPVRTVVLARSLADFHAWCRQTNTSPRDRAVLYASGPQTLHGLDQVEIVRHGMWWDRLDEAAYTEAVTSLAARQHSQADATVTSSWGPYAARN
ncbi:hypothetical protein ACL07V_37285 [Streptomyces sp. MB22_4]|uniref:hypothetical protein n=1 Tax=Streptomyces sp. MB22_4 TaxID=3383120 RepID=UPI0039A3A050